MSFGPVSYTTEAMNEVCMEDMGIEWVMFVMAMCAAWHIKLAIELFG